jgi:hypothetical protein
LSEEGGNMEVMTAEVRLNTPDYEALAQESRQLSLSVEELLARLAGEYLRRKSFTEKKRKKLDFMSLANLGHSGASDISVNHDKYLGEAYRS